MANLIREDTPYRRVLKGADGGLMRSESKRQGRSHGGVRVGENKRERNKIKNNVNNV